MAIDSTTEEIRRRADITEIVSQYVSLSPAGNGRMKACCPFHDEKTPSFYVSRDKGFYKCFGCLEENEPIWTAHGLRPIKEVQIGDLVLDAQGNWQPILAREAKSGPLLALETGAMRRDALQLTPDHTCLAVREAEARRVLPYLYESKSRGTRFKSSYRRFKTKGEVKLREVAAQDLKVGDFWVFPVISERNRVAAPLQAPEVCAPYVIGKRVCRVEELPVDEETAFVYGLYLAEGSTNPRSVRWTFHRDEKELAFEVARVLETRFGLPTSHFLPPNKMTREVICCKTDLARQFEHWFGKGCAHKKIPAQALNWQRTLQRALIRGYLCGDGDKRGASSSVSASLSYGLFALGIQCGINVSLAREAAYTDKTGLSHRAAWSLFGRAREGIDGFYERIGDTLYYWSRLTKITSLEGEHRVVDITVAGSHSFVSKMAAVHNCGQSGDVFKFVQAMENTDFIGARKILGARYNVEVKSRAEMSPEQREKVSERDKLLKVTAAAAHFFREQFSGNNGLAARDYARIRGLSRETVEKFGIGYAPDAWDGLRSNLTRKYGFTDDEGVSVGVFIEKKSVEGELGGMFAENAARRVYDRYRHRLMFPIWDESGRVIAFGGRALEGGQYGTPDAKYINSPESPLFHKSNVLFAWHIARAEVPKRGGVIITEGYMDAIAMHEGGFPHTVATLGTAVTAQHVALLRRLSPKAVYLCFDGDSAGMKAALRTAPLFAENSLDVRVVRLPIGHDPDTYIREFGETGMQSALDEAIPLARYRLVSILDGHDLQSVEGRSEAMRQSAEIINDLGSETERSGYVTFLVDELLKIEKPGNRTAWERRRGDLERLVKNELRADEGRSGQKERLREVKIEGGHLAPTRQKSFSSPKWEAIRLEEEKAANDLHEATQSISDAAGVAPGVLKAEKCLIAAMLSFPTWRTHILEQLPLAKWTDETHGEIVVAARKYGAEEEIQPVEFTDDLSNEAQKIVGEVMLGDLAANSPDALIVADWIARVEMHWARQAEIEMSELIKGKIERQEPISEEEKAAFSSALEATRRKVPVPEK